MPQAFNNKELRVLYAIQGTGNGHVARASALIPEIKKYAKVDVLLSGIQVDLSLPFEVKYRLKGLSFIFGKRGGIDLWKMLKEVSFFNFCREVKKLDLSGYDLVLNDFEPVSAWACKLSKVHCIQISHQFAVNHPLSPKPSRKSVVGNVILKSYAPCSDGFGFHFKPYADTIFTPIIRDLVRQTSLSIDGYYTVYLPAYDDSYLKTVLAKLHQFQWQIFSKHAKKSYEEGNIKIFPLQNDAFVKSMAGSDGVFCGAGFETPAEAIFMRKKLLVIPMKNQYEQYCNAASLEEMGVKVLKHLDVEDIGMIEEWLENGKVLWLDYPDNKAEVIQEILTFANEKFFQNHFHFSFYNSM